MKHAKEIIVWISKVFVIISPYYVQYAYSCCGNSAPPLPACVPSRVRVGWRSLFPVALWLIRAVVVTIYRS